MRIYRILLYIAFLINLSEVFYLADLIFRHLAGADGEGVYKNGKTGFSVSYFKKKEIEIGRASCRERVSTFV